MEGKTSLKIKHQVMSVPFMLRKITVLSTIVLKLTVAISPIPWSDYREQRERKQLCRAVSRGQGTGEVVIVPCQDPLLYHRFEHQSFVRLGPPMHLRSLLAAPVSALGDPPPKTLFFGSAAAGSRQAPITQWYRVFFFLIILKQLIPWLPSPGNYKSEAIVILKQPRLLLIS